MFCLNFNCKLTLMFKLATIHYIRLITIRLNPVSGKVVSGTSLQEIDQCDAMLQHRMKSTHSLEVVSVCLWHGRYNISNGSKIRILWWICNSRNYRLMWYIDISVITGIFKIPNIRYSNSQIPEISKLSIFSVVCYTTFAYS